MRKILLLVLMLAPLAIAVEQNDVEFAKPGGVAMTLDLRVPDGKGPLPTAIIVHGGSFSHGNKRTYVTPLFDVLSNAGFAWFTINYRLAPDYQFPAAVDDVQSAVIWVKSNAPKYRIDPKRVVLIGESAGGYLVAYAGAHADRSARVAAVVDFYGIHPKVHPDIARLSGPVLAHFAKHDKSVSEAAAAELVARIQDAGKEVEAHTYDAKHAFFNDQRPQVHDRAAAELAWIRTLDFLRRAL